MLHIRNIVILFSIFLIGRLEPTWDVGATETAKEKRDSFERNTGTLASHTNSRTYKIIFEKFLLVAEMRGNITVWLVNYNND